MSIINEIENKTDKNNQSHRVPKGIDYEFLVQYYSYLIENKINKGKTKKINTTHGLVSLSSTLEAVEFISVECLDKRDGFSVFEVSMRFLFLVRYYYNVNCDNLGSLVSTDMNGEILKLNRSFNHTTILAITQKEHILLKPSRLGLKRREEERYETYRPRRRASKQSKFKKRANPSEEIPRSNKSL